jgi:hypothetical protein
MRDILMEEAVAWQMSHRQTGLQRTINFIQYYFYSGACRSERFYYFYDLMPSLDNIALKPSSDPLQQPQFGKNCQSF